MRRFALLAVSSFLMLAFAVTATGVDAATRPFWLPAPKPVPPPEPPAPPTVSEPIAAWGRSQHCPGANATLARSGAPRFRRAVACLVARQRRSHSTSDGARTLGATVTVVGQVTPARAVRALLARADGLRLARGTDRLVSVRVRQAARSRVAFSLR